MSYKEATKTEASTRVLVAPPAMMELLRLVLEAFHTDAGTGEVEETARLVPGLRREEAGQLGYREAFAAASVSEGLGSADLGFRVSPHLWRNTVATDLAWQPGIEDGVRRRFIDHRAADDV